MPCVNTIFPNRRLNPPLNVPREKRCEPSRHFGMHVAAGNPRQGTFPLVVFLFCHKQQAADSSLGRKATQVARRSAEKRTQGPKARACGSSQTVNESCGREAAMALFLQNGISRVECDLADIAAPVSEDAMGEAHWRTQAPPQTYRERYRET